LNTLLKRRKEEEKAVSQPSALKFYCRK